MAVIRRDASYLERPGIFTCNVDESSTSEIAVADSHDYSQSVDDIPDEISTTRGGEELAQPPGGSLAVAGGGGTSQGGSMLGGSYSPKLRQAFLGQSSARQSAQSEVGTGQTDLTRLPSTASSISRGSCSSQTGLLQSSSSNEKREDTSRTNVSNENDKELDEVFDHVTRRHSQEGVTSGRPSRLKYRGMQKISGLSLIK